MWEGARRSKCDVGDGVGGGVDDDVDDGFCMTLHRTVTVRITRAYAVVSGPTCTSPLIEEKAQLWQYRVPFERPA